MGRGGERRGKGGGGGGGRIGVQSGLVANKLIKLQSRIYIQSGQHEEPGRRSINTKLTSTIKLATTEMILHPENVDFRG